MITGQEKKSLWAKRNWMHGRIKGMAQICKSAAAGQQGPISMFEQALLLQVADMLDHASDNKRGEDAKIEILHAPCRRTS